MTGIKRAHYMLIEDGDIRFGGGGIRPQRDAGARHGLTSKKGTMLETDLQDAMFFFGDAPTSRGTVAEVNGYERQNFVAAHRGHFGGGIVENTIPAFEAAIRCGADIVEMDIPQDERRSADSFHDPSPMRLLGLPGQTEGYTWTRN